MNMDLEPILTLIKALDESSLQKLRLTSGDFTLELEKTDKVYITESSIAQNMENVKVGEKPSAKQEAPKEEFKYHVVRSPLVGTFYRSPSPEAPPFVEAGDIVSPGQTLCIVEALKVMNEIESDIRGRIEKILVENGEIVEYGQPLFEISPL